MTNKEKFLKLVEGHDSEFLEQLEYRIKNRTMLRESQKIALKVLLKLDELGWSQKKLAEKMNVSPQQINKIVSGKENLTLTTIINLENVLNIQIINDGNINVNRNVISSATVLIDYMPNNSVSSIEVKNPQFKKVNQLDDMNYHSDGQFNTAA